MPWNHRVMRRTYVGDFETIVVDEIYEVYYDDDGNVDGWTTDPVGPSFYVNEDDGQGSIRDDIARFMRATELPILDYETGKEISNGS